MLRSLIHYWRLNLAVVLGVAVASAVLTGALLAGDSVRGSLRGLTLERLGSIDVALVSERLLPQDLARRQHEHPAFGDGFGGLAPALILRGAAIHGDTRTRASQVDALLELVELNHKKDVDVQGLSRGMQQRLSLARALVHEPKLLVLDEPASGLDPRARVELREIIKELSRQGHTILLSSHILAEMQDLCDRIGVIEAGKLLAQGTPRDLDTAMAHAHAVNVGVLGGEAEREVAREAMLASGALAVVVLGDGTLRGEIPGGAEAAADLLADLVRAGVRVNEFSEEESGLEGLFLRLTQGIVR